MEYVTFPEVITYEIKKFENGSYRIARWANNWIEEDFDKGRFKTKEDVIKFLSENL